MSTEKSVSAGDGPRVIIQIPCFNEADTLAVALEDLPRRLPGVSSVEWLVVDDGSRDATVEIARACGVDHIVRLPANRGLAEAWTAGVEACLALGADIIVHTDADNQYQAAAIPDLVAAVRSGADVAVGARPIADIPHFSPIKKVLQHAGSAAMRRFSRTAVADAPSGFRAMRRDAALRLAVTTQYTYTLETLIHAGHAGLRVVNVPVGVNGDLRPSRLVKSIPAYVRRSLGTMVRVWLLYRGASVAAGMAVCAGIGAGGLALAAIGGVVAWGASGGFALAALGLMCTSMILDSMALTRRALMETRRAARAAALGVSLAEPEGNDHA